MVDIQIIKEWLAEADEDLEFASANLKRGNRFFGRICFHLQQAAEKYLKAYIVANELGLKKIHNLHILLDICKKKDEKFEELRKDCLFLNVFYVDTRYPTFWPVGRTRLDAGKAQEAAQRIGDFVKKNLTSTGRFANPTTFLTYST